MIMLFYSLYGGLHDYNKVNEIKIGNIKLIPSHKIITKQTYKWCSFLFHLDYSPSLSSQITINGIEQASVRKPKSREELSLAQCRT